MKVKVGDTVKVIAGADKGKTGKVIKTLKTEARVVVEGVHIVKKHSLSLIHISEPTRPY